MDEHLKKQNLTTYFFLLWKEVLDSLVSHNFIKCLAHYKADFFEQQTSASPQKNSSKSHRFKVYLLNFLIDIKSLPQQTYPEKTKGIFKKIRCFF